MGDTSSADCVKRLLDLPDDTLERVLSACDACTLCGLAAVCASLRAAAAAEAPWLAALETELDVPPEMAVAADVGARNLFRRLTRLSDDAEITVDGCLTDGGIDGVAMQAWWTQADSERGGVAMQDVPETARDFWVANAFDSTPHRCYCSEEAPAGGGVIVAGRIGGVVSADDEVARAAEAERRQFMCERLERAAPHLWGWPAEEFGGLHTTSTEHLEAALQVAWHAHGAHSLLLGDIPLLQRGRAERRLRRLLEEAEERRLARRGIAVACMRAGGGHGLLVDRRAWEANSDGRRLSSPSGGGSGGPATSIGGGGSSEGAAAWRRASGSSSPRVAADVSDGGLPPSPEAVAPRSLPLLPAGRLCLLRSLCVRRGIMCSCPVQVGVLLGCRVPLTAAALYSPRLAVLEDLLTLEQVLAAAPPAASATGAAVAAPAAAIGAAAPAATAAATAATAAATAGSERAAAGSRSAAAGSGAGGSGAGGSAATGSAALPPCIAVHEGAEATVVEFSTEASFGDVYPIAWFRFHMGVDEAVERQQREPGWRETGEVVYALRQPRTTCMLIAKLVAAEDRMLAMNDDHDEPNVDLEYIGATGHLVC